MHYVGPGPWGSGQDHPLNVSEGNDNFYEADTRLGILEGAMPAAGRSISTVTQLGNVLTITFTDATESTFVFPDIQFSFLEGGWQPSTVMIAGSIFYKDGNLYITNINHTSALTFDPDAINGFGTRYYKKMFPTPAIGKQTIWIPAGAMLCQNTDGAVVTNIELATNKNMYKVAEFDSTTQQFTQFEVGMPIAWNGGTISFQAYWLHPATTVNFGVVFGLDAVAIGNGEVLDAAFGTAQIVTDVGGVDGQLYISPESAAITIAGTISPGDLANFRLHRNPADAADTLAVAAQLIGIKLFYTTDKASDD